MQQTILPRVARGDTAAMDECLERYGGLVWSLCRRLAPSESEDLAQEIFIDLWRNAWRFRLDLGSETAFISTLARRRLIDHRRRLTRQPQLASLDAMDFAVETPGPEIGTFNGEREQLKHCWAKLSERDRGLLNLSIHDGCTQTEIAAKTETPLGTVKTVIRRALIQLRDCVSRATERSSGGSVP